MLTIAALRIPSIEVVLRHFGTYPVPFGRSIQAGVLGVVESFRKVGNMAKAFGGSRLVAGTILITSITTTRGAHIAEARFM